MKLDIQTGHKGTITHELKTKKIIIRTHAWQKIYININENKLIIFIWIYIISFTTTASGVLNQFLLWIILTNRLHACLIIRLNTYLTRTHFFP